MIAPSTRPRPASAPKSLTVIVADDSAELKNLLTQWLEEAGHVVCPVSNGRELVALIQQRPFDLVITDILMPDGDGWDAIAEVQRLRPGTRSVAISGGVREIPASACLRVARGAGAIGVLKKPFSRVELLGEVARVIGR